LGRGDEIRGETGRQKEEEEMREEGDRKKEKKKYRDKRHTIRSCITLRWIYTLASFHRQHGKAL
jgi:hypothetical protein